MSSDILNIHNLSIKRSASALWRESDGGTILVLSEDSGRAFILDGPLAKVWPLLNNFVSVDFIKTSIPDHSFKNFIDMVNIMTDGGLIELSTVVTELKGSTKFHELSSMKVVESSVSEIEFGGCDCSGGFAGFVRWISCNYGNQNRTNSIVY